MRATHAIINIYKLKSFFNLDRKVGRQKATLAVQKVGRQKSILAVPLQVPTPMIKSPIVLVMMS